MIAHHGQIRAPCHAHSHDGGNLRNAHGAHDRVIAKNPAEVVGVRKNVFLEREKNARRIHQIDRRNVILDGDILRPNHFFCRHGEERAGFHCCVVSNKHEGAAANRGEARDRASARCATPFFVHFERGINPKLKEL